MPMRQKDIAKELGISPAVVSLVLRDHRTTRASAETKARILKLVERNGGRAPETKARPAVALLLPADSRPDWVFQHDLLRGAQQRARELGWDLLVEHWHDGVGELLRREHLTGAILAMRPDADLLDAIPRAIPCCVALHPDEAGRHDSVVVDEDQGIAEAVAALVARGHRRLGYLGYIPPQWVRRGFQHDARPAAFRAAVAGHGLSLRESDLQYQQTEVLADVPFVPLAERLRRWLVDDPQAPTALLCFNDGLAGQVLTTATQLALRVPHDLSLVAIAAVGLAPHLVPALSTVEQDTEAVGRAAVNCLHDRPQGRARRGAYRVTCPSRFVDRASIADRS